MKKILLVLLTIVICNPSFANDWFPQQEPPSETTKPKTQDILPKTVPPGQNQGLAVFLKAPCGPWKEMQATIIKYKEELLFHGTGLTFGAQGQVYNGAMMFFTNQERGSWTVLQVFGDGMACMIMNGSKFEPYVGDQPYGERR